MLYYTLTAIVGTVIGFILGVLLMMDTAMRVVRRKHQEAARLQELEIQAASREAMEEMAKKLEGKTPDELKAMGFDLNITNTKVNESQS